MRFFLGLYFSFLLLLVSACEESSDTEKIKHEIIMIERAFAEMAVEKGIAEAFFFFADENAVIKRQNDTLIAGKHNIRHYYSADIFGRSRLSWSPDFVGVSDCGNMAYTYGKYLLKVWNISEDTLEYRGIFHTVWKRQKDGLWKYVWD